jgi:23S rRNA (pseudouridine1915-N3)-methyltransferase
MKIIIIAIGKEKDFPAAELVSEYTDRVAHYYPIEWKFIPTSSVDEENKRVIKYIENIHSNSYIIALDETGKSYTSAQFADFFQKKLIESVQTLIFIIGGSYGLSDEVRGRAHTQIALSSLTFPHQLVRLILVEQLYRALTIIRGEKYHH